MPSRPRASLLILVALLPRPAAAQSNGAPTPPVPGTLLPLVSEHLYTVTARVRILLFWYSRDDVGLARLRWRVGPDDRRGYELLIASDPDRAPRKINQWGFVAEETGPDGAALLGLGKDSDPKSLEEAEAGTEAEGAARQFLYKAIRTEVRGQTGRTGVMRLALPRDPTYRDLDAVIAQLPASPPSPKHYTLMPGVRRGYLPTLQEAVDDCLAWYRAGRPAKESPIGVVRPYVYDGKLYELVVRSSKPVPSAKYRGRPFTDLIHTEFVITNTVSRGQTRFRVDFPAAGPMAGAPVHVVYRPRWWFEVEIVLDDSSGRKVAAARRENR